MRLTKIGAMHHAYGKDEGRKCGDCCNLWRFSYFGDTYRKCVAYGVSHSTATDWRMSDAACGLWGKDFEAMKLRPLVEVRQAKAHEPIDGQISLI